MVNPSKSRASFDVAGSHELVRTRTKSDPPFPHSFDYQRLTLVRLNIVRAAWITLLFAAHVVLAQPVPKVNSISPEWIQRGTTADVVLTGENLGNATGFIFSGETGLSATNVPAVGSSSPSVTIESPSGTITRAEPPRAVDQKRVIARVTASTTAALNPRELRVVTPTGVSNPLLLNVGHLPEVSEAGAANLSMPAAVSGVIGASAEVDKFKFKATKGQEIIFEVDAARRGSPLDASLTVTDTKGKELARNEDFNGLDSLLTFNAPEDGEYVLHIRDFRYMGGGNFNYRLYAGALPYVESIFPFGGQRGKLVEVALSGRNLDGTSKMNLNIAATSPLGRQDIRASTPKGLSNLLPFDVSDYPDFSETEPNDEVKAPNTVAVPVAINGRLISAKDTDRYKFKSDKDQKLVCDVIAYRFGSMLDALLVLTDTNGAVLQQNDDSAVADARIEFDAKKDTEYVLAIRDLTHRGGEKFGYRLSIRPPTAGESGFTARFLPDTPRVSRGSHTRIRCEVTRLGGFDGPVRFALEDLPSGITAEPIVMTAAPSSGLMVISALKEAALGSFPIKLVASGVVNGKTVRRTAEQLSGDKPAREAFITVLDTAPFTIEPITLSADLEQNETARVEVMAQRKEGFTGDIKLNVEGFSAGRDPITKSFTVAESVISSTQSIGRIKLQAKLDSEVGTRTIIVKGESADTVQYSRPIPVTISQVPFIVSSTLTRLSVTALPTNAQSAASEAATAVKLERRTGFTNEVQLTVEGLPTGIISTLDKIPANGAESTFKLVATEKAPPGTNSLTIVAAGMHNDRNYKHRSAPITLIINAPEVVDTNIVSAATSK